MKVIGSDNGSPKNKIILIASVVLLSILVFLSILYFVEKEDTESMPDIASKDNEKVDEISIGKYKEAGIDIDDEEKMAEEKEKTKEEIKDSIESDDIGKITKGSVQESRYSGISVEDEVNKMIEENNARNDSSAEGSSKGTSSSSGLSSSSSSGNNASNNATGTGKGSSSTGKNSKKDGSDDTESEEPDYSNPEADEVYLDGELIDNAGESAETPGETESVDREGEMIDEDMDNLNKLIATASLEVNTTTRIVRDTISANLNSSDEYNAILLREALIINNPESSGIDNLTYGDFFNITKYWLFYYPEDQFSWKMIDKAAHLYNGLLTSEAYKSDFSSISNQIISIIDDGTEIDGEYVSFNMVFQSNGKVYRGIFSIQDNMPRLLDLSVL